MGNSNDKLKPNSSTLQEFVPPTRQKKSPVITKMLTRVLRRIEQENYFSRSDSYFAPKFVFYEQGPQRTWEDQERDQFDSTQKLYWEANNNLEKSTEVYDSNSKAQISSQNSLTDKNFPKANTKDHKPALSIKSKNSARMPDGDSSIPANIVYKGGDMKSQKYFATQSKVNTNTGNQPLKNIHLDYSKGPGRASINGDGTGHNQSYPSKNNIQALMSPSNVVEDDDKGINVGENFEKQPVKKKLYVNCDLERKLFSLPPKIQFNILLFLINEYVNLVSVSPIWYFKVNEMLETELIGIDNSFIKTYMNILSFKKSYFSIAPYEFSNRKGFRMDRNVVAEVLQPLIGKTVIISFTYELTRKKNVEYKANYKFDVVRKGNRSIWIHKEEAKSNFDQNMAFVQPIMPVCVHDNIKLALNFYNLSGLVNLQSIEWKSPIIEAIPNIPKEIQSNFLQGIDKNRICEMEEVSDEWFLFEYFESKNKIQYDMFEPQLSLKETRCAGVDIVTMKSQYIATSLGEVKKAAQKLGINIFVVEADAEVITEVKRLGLSHDLENFLQLRQGDKLILYLTKGG